MTCNCKASFVTMSRPSLPYEERMRDRIGQESDLSGVTFAGGLRQEMLDAIVRGLSEQKAMPCRDILASHVGGDTDREPLEEHRVATGTYTEEEAEKWIAEYHEATKDIRD